jgi:hypothetical protein
MDRWATSGSGDLNMFRANFDRTGYDDMEDLPGKGARCLAIGDLNDDGCLDLVMANYIFNSNNPDSQIYWGKVDGTWDTDNPTELDVTRGTAVDIGDFNGDGHPDLAFGAYHSSLSVSSCIFLNNGDGTFDYTPDITYTDEEYSRCAAGDMNGDGYDDIVFGYNHDIYLYNGGPSGTSTTPHSYWNYPNGYLYRLVIEDLDADGHNDLVIALDVGNDRVPVFMGTESGLGTTPDYYLDVGDDSIPYSATAGDINGDGYMEVFLSTRDSWEDKVYVYEGFPTGYEGSSPHKIDVGSYIYAMGVADINADGYNDLVMAYNSVFRVYYGGDVLPTDPDINKDGPYGPYTLVIAGNGKTSTRKFAGRMTTQQLNKPDGKDWDVLVIEGSLAKNTSVRLTVQDSSGRPLSGLEDLTTLDVDLSGVTAPSIKVDLWLESDLNTSTPVIDRLRVKWREPRTWRDQFWGEAKVHSMLGTTVSDGRLRVAVTQSDSPDLLITGMLAQEGSIPRSTLLTGAPGPDYALETDLDVRAASAVDVGDIDGDGYTDMVFASYMSTGSSYTSSSPLFMGTPVGWRATPDHSFATTGAADVVLEDLDGDGYTDVVFAQERNSETYGVNSTLFWGSAHGWSDEPDVEFITTGASGVTAADLDGDGDLDLAFSCYKAASTATDSMVFLQAGDGFHGDAPDHLLPTKGARAVTAADLDGDGNVDLVFANSFSGGFAEIDSYIYWGKASGGFGDTPASLPTVGAEDVLAADLDGDGDLDLAFANHMDNNKNNSVDSYVYLNTGGTFAASPDARLPTLGASAVAAIDLDGTGRMDLVFACLRYGENTSIPSLVFLGGTGGWSSSPDVLLPTAGASDVVAGNIIRKGSAGYLSQRITPSDIDETGDFHTLRYSAHLEGGAQGAIHLVDADTWEVLATTNLKDGEHEWVVEGAFAFRDHPSVRVMVTGSDLGGAKDLSLDDLGLNWTRRVHAPPVVVDMVVDEPSIYRTTSTVLAITVTDEYTPLDMLDLTVQYRLAGTEEWERGLLGSPSFEDGVWKVTFNARSSTVLGTYQFRASVTDSDRDSSGFLEGNATVQVMNRLPSAPEVQISPGRPVTTATLRVEMIQSAQDPEGHPLTYNYKWFRDDVLVEDITGDSVPPGYTSRGERWTVEVRAFDGDDEGPAVTAWRCIENAAPITKEPLPDPVMDEDTESSDWLILVNAFMDPDGDTVTWKVDPAPTHITVTIDHETGVVTIAPDADWNGKENVTFVATDGELQTSQTVTVTVTPVNDAPRLLSLNGQPVTSDPVVYDIKQGTTLVISPAVVDVEGHELVFDVNTTAVDLDGVTGEIRFEPDNDAVGTLRFALTVWDVESPSTKVRVNIRINVENENDPMEEARITNPEDMTSYKVNQSFFLTGVCYDPDTPYGQVLNYTWTSSLSGVLGYGNSLTLSLDRAGVHTITLTVSDGEFEQTDTITLEIVPRDEGPGPDPDPDPDPTDDDDASAGGSPTGIMVAVLVLVIAGGAGGYVLIVRRKASEEDAGLPEIEPMNEREALQRMADMAREAADAIEGSKNGNGNGNGSGNGGDQDTWVETEDRDGIEIASASVAETQLRMQAQVTREAPSEVQALFADIEKNGFHASEEDAEQLRIDNLKRKYHNTIGQLPYGIPSKELADRDWNDLAAVLATGEKRTVEGDREVTAIDGRWYYSDMDDPANFLKEHGAKPKAAKASATPDRDALLARLEERFILGEISEESYKELRGKYDA